MLINISLELRVFVPALQLRAGQTQYRKVFFEGSLMISVSVSLFLQSIRQIRRQVYNTTIASDSRHHGFKQNDAEFKISMLEIKKRVTHCIVSYSYAEYRLRKGI